MFSQHAEWHTYSEAINLRSIRPIMKILPSMLVIGLAFVLIGCNGKHDTGESPHNSSTNVSSGTTETLIIYSGRSESLIQPLLDQYTKDTGASVAVKYAKSTTLAALILEEGERCPADVVLFQDPGALGVLSQANMFNLLPNSILNRVDSKYRARSNDWVGTSGRVRTVVYNTDSIDPKKDLPASILDFTAPKWQGRLGWAPTNGSFQAFVTAMRMQIGDDETLAWLKGIQENNPQVYPKNTPIVRAAGNGEIDAGFVNHYYLYRFIAEEGIEFKARNHFLSNTDPGSLLLVSGTGILKTSENLDGAERFIGYLLSNPAQTYFSEEINEYPLAGDIPPNPNLDPPLTPLNQVNAPDIDLSKLQDLEGTLNLLRQSGVLP